MDPSRRLGTSPIGPLLLRFALPSIIGMVVGALYNIVDRIFIGRGVGPLALAGVTVAFAFQLVQIAFSVLVGVGASALISISLGEGDKAKAERVLGNGFALNLGISAAVAVLGLAFMGPLLRLAGASPEVLPHARAFLTVALLGTPFATVSIGLNALIRAEGNPRVAMVTQLIGPLVNVALCPLFIFTLKLGVAGSALANVAAQAIGTGWVLAHYGSGRSVLRLRLGNFVPRPALARAIMAIGSASALGELSFALTMALLNHQLVRYGGDLAVSAMGIVFAISNLVFLTLLGTAMGVQPIVGYNLGAGLPHRVRRVERLAIGGATAFCLLVYALVQGLPGSFVALFAGNAPELRPIAVGALRRTFLALPLMGLQVLGASYFQAAGRPLAALVLGLSRQLLLLIPLIWILPRFLGLDGVWYAGPVADVLSFTATALVLGREFRQLDGAVAAPLPGSKPV